MLSTSQIAELLNQLYLKQEVMNQRDFNYAGIDSRNVKESLYISCCEWSKMLTTNLKSTIYQEQQGQSA